MKTHTRLVTLITLGALLAFMFGAVSCTGPTAGKYEAATGITPGQTALLAGKWWVDYEQAKASNEILRTQASPVTSTKAVLNVQPQASAPTPRQNPPPAEPPPRLRRPDAHHRLQIAST